MAPRRSSIGVSTAPAAMPSFSQPPNSTQPMDDPYLEQLLSRLNRRAADQPPARDAATASGDKSSAVAAAPPEPAATTAARPSGLDDPELGLREKIAALSAQADQYLPDAAARLTGSNPLRPGPSLLATRPAAARPPQPTAPAANMAAAAPVGETFVPRAPASLADSRLSESEIEGLILKFLLAQFTASGRDIAEHLRLPFSLVEPLLARLKADQCVVHKGSAPLSDYLYQLTVSGVDDARRHLQHSTYAGVAPVTLEDYVASVQAQSITGRSFSVDDLKPVFADLLVPPELQNQIGQAIHGGSGFFLYGPAGNGKTSIAERVARAFGQFIWVPHALSIAGEIVRLYDPGRHQEAPLTAADGIDPAQVDRRWLRIRRPTIVAGGELTLDQLEITINRATGISEAPLQLKSSCGILVIDDFGRQRLSTAELLNRWIVPLDRRHDYLTLPSGKTIQVPFDQLLVFSTNLEPKDLLDEAFLRRLPYKIEVADPSEAAFRELFRLYARRLEVGYDELSVEHLIARHYRLAKRAFRFCHPRDLLIQVRNYCKFNKLPVALTCEAIDVAVKNYFALVG